MFVKKTLQDLKAQLQSFPRMIEWEEVHVGETYHIPRILSLEPRDLKIVNKNQDKAEYQRMDSNKDPQGWFHKTSIFAVFLVKKRKY